MNALQLMNACGITMMTASTWQPHLQAAMDRFGIEPVDEQAAFLAQCAYESGRFAFLEENLNYSAQRLMQVWPDRFPNLTMASYYEHAPQKLGSYVYANLMGNGPESTGDGYTFRGRGPIGITGRQMYYQIGTITGLPLMTYPDMLLDPASGALSAGALWQLKDCSRLLQLDGFSATTQAINGGQNGAAQRQALFAQAKQALAVQS